MKFKKLICLLLTVLIASSTVGYNISTKAASVGRIVTVKMTSLGSIKTLNVTINGSYKISEINQSLTTDTTYAITIENSKYKVSGGGKTYYPGVSFNLIKLDTSTTKGIKTGKYSNCTGDFKFSIENGYIVLRNYVDIEIYTVGVIAAEMGNSFPLEALKAQAVAARTYAYNKDLSLTDGPDTQAYIGYNSSYTNVLNAVNATKGEVLTYNNSLIYAFYAASNGGWTDRTDYVWSAYYPYYQVVEDPFDISNPDNTYLYTLRFPKVINSTYKLDSKINDFLTPLIKEQLVNKGYPSNQAFTITGFSKTITHTPPNSKYPADSPVHTKATITSNVSVTSASAIWYGTVSAQGGLNMREGPGTSYDIIANIPNGTKVEILQDKDANGWYKVKYLSYTGYVSSVYLIADPKPTGGGTVLETVNVDVALRDLCASLGKYRYRLFADGEETNYLTIQGRGSQHGIGLSQRGAQQRARQGHTYKQILSFYFVGTQVTAWVTSVVSGLSAAPDNNQGIKLSWSSLSGADSYEIYRSDSQSGTYSLVKTVTTNSYTDANLEIGKSYYYKVRAHLAIGDFSGYSAVVTARAIPCVPANFAAVADSVSSIKLSWGAVNGASGYQVFYSTTQNGTYNLVANTTQTNCIHKNLSKNTTYYYKVRSYTWSAPVAYSNYATVSAKPVLPAPATFTAVSQSYSSIKLTWSAVSAASGYQVFKSTSQNGAYSLVTNTKELSCIDTNLSADKTYYYKVRAYRWGSTAIYSEYKFANAKPVLSAPTNFIGAPEINGDITLSWDSAEGASGYQVFYSTSKNGNYSLLKNTTELSCVHSSLNKETTYYYKVRAYRWGSPILYSSYKEISAKPFLQIPLNFKSELEFNNDITLTWDAVPAAVGYQIWRSPTIDGEYIWAATVTENRNTVAALPEGTNYYYKVRAYRWSSDVLYSDFSTAVYSCPKPVTPTNLFAVKSGNKIVITWDSVRVSSGYQVFRSTSQNGTYAWQATTDTNSFTTAMPPQGTTYYYKVRNFRWGSPELYSDFSECISTNQVFAAPLNVVASAGIKNVKLTWNSVYGAAGYQVFRSTSQNGTYSWAGSTSVNSFTNTGLITGTTYYYKVRAYRWGNPILYTDFSPSVSSKAK